MKDNMADSTIPFPTSGGGGRGDDSDSSAVAIPTFWPVRPNRPPLTARQLAFRATLRVTLWTFGAVSVAVGIWLLCRLYL